MNRIFQLLLLILCFSCSNQNNKSEFENGESAIRFEKIRYYSPDNQLIKIRVGYYFENGLPHGWTEYDSAGALLTDYYYEYNDEWLQSGARYIEPEDSEYSYERVTFKNDSTQITEWFDSAGLVYYTMIDDLNKAGQTYRATFIGDTIHGYDSTFYTPHGFVERIFFTNNKGKIYNDRSFKYDRVNELNDWVARRKIMGDTLNERQVREVYYDNSFTSDDGKYYEGVVSSFKQDDNEISFSADGNTLFFTRYEDWMYKTGYIGEKTNGVFTEVNPVPALDSIYNGAISPTGEKIIYSRNGIWILEKQSGSWNRISKIQTEKDFKADYFNWLNNKELVLHTSSNEGDIMLAILDNYTLSITDSLSELNSDITEFSPFIDSEKKFIIFTRYEGGNLENQGFFISYNNIGKWSTPKKIKSLPYGWGAYIFDNRFYYTDGEDIYSLELSKLEI